MRLWELLTGMLEFGHVYKLQRPKGAYHDQQAISEALQPYLRGRDWVSVDRGRIVEPGNRHDEEIAG